MKNHNIEPGIEIMKQFADYFETSIDFLVGHTEIRHIIEPLEKFDLNNEEAILVKKYRKLPIKFRASISSLLDDLLSKN